MTTTSDRDPAPSESDADAPEGDGVLQLLVMIANESDPDDPKAFSSITLSVGGLIVSGELIAHGRFWRELSQVPGLSGFATRILKVSEQTVAAEDTTATKVELPKFIHLRNAKFWNSPETPIPTQGLHWRGRISSVDGYSFGTLGSSQPT